MLFAVCPEFIQKEIQGHRDAQIQEGGNEMGDAEKPFLNIEQQSHQHKLGECIGSIYPGQDFVPGLPAAVLLSEYKTAVQQIGDKYRNQEGNEIGDLLMHVEQVIAHVGNQVGQYCI